MKFVCKKLPHSSSSHPHPFLLTGNFRSNTMMNRMAYSTENHKVPETTNTPYSTSSKRKKILMIVSYILMKAYDKIGLFIGAIYGSYIGHKGTVSITGSSFIIFALCLFAFFLLMRYGKTRLKMKMFGVMLIYHLLLSLGLALLAFFLRIYFQSLLFGFDDLMMMSAILLTDGPQFPTWDCGFMNNAQPGHGAPEQPDVAGNPPVNLELEAQRQRRLEFYRMTHSRFLDQIKDWPGFSIQLQAVEDAYFVQSTIEAYLVEEEDYNPAVIAALRGDLRDVIFYNRTYENELLSPETIHRYVADIRANGTRNSIPYRKVLKAEKRGDISFFDMAASRERMQGILDRRGR